jgi:hypothetical protein
MAIKLSGTSYLQHADGIVKTFPFSMAVWYAEGSAGQQFLIAQGQSTADYFSAIVMAPDSTKKQAWSRHPGESTYAEKTTAPHPSTTVLKLAVIVCPDANTRIIYFDSNAGVSWTQTISRTIANDNLCLIGARAFNGEAVSLRSNGHFAEAHWFNVALTPTQIEAMRDLSVLPNATTGWVDGVDLETYQASGNYLSRTGTRTFTASGTITQSALSHPVTRSAPGVTINATTGTATASGSQAAVGTSSNLTVNATTGTAAASGQAASVQNYIKTGKITNNTRTPLPLQAVSYNWLPAWRIGDALPAGTIGTGTTDADGRLTTAIPRAAGVLLVAVRNTNALDDFIYYEAFP